MTRCCDILQGNPKRETPNPKPETRNPKPETRHLKPKPRNPKSERRAGKVEEGVMGVINKKTGTLHPRVDIAEVANPRPYYYEP